MLNNVSTNIFIQALILTVITLILIVIVGCILNKLKNILIGILTKTFGVGIAIFVANKLTFIGTIHHELAHALFAFCTGAKVTKIELFHPHGNTLGHVEYRVRGNKIMQSIQHTMSAIAPMVCGIITETILYIKVLPKCVDVWQYILLAYTMISILLHMTMSDQDIKMMLKGLPACTLLMYIVYYIVLRYALI